MNICLARVAASVAVEPSLDSYMFGNHELSAAYSQYSSNVNC